MRRSSRVSSVALVLALVVPACGGSPEPPAQQPPVAPPTALPESAYEPQPAQPDPAPLLEEANVPPETPPPATRPPAPPQQARKQPPPRRPSTPRPPRTAPPARDTEPTEADREAYERDLAREQAGRARREQEERDARAVTLPMGTRLSLAMKTAASSATSREGDPIEARLEGATGESGAVALPAGAVLRGHVEEAVGSGRVKGRARLVMVFDEIVVDGKVTPIRSVEIALEAEADHKRDAAVAGGAAAAGAVIGGILGGKDGARKGAIIGGAAGAGGVLATKGKEVEVNPGDRHTVRTRETVRIE